jgi:hypothetical protein
MVDDRVAAVELRLDGATVSSMEGAPWSTIVDFGGELSAVIVRPRSGKCFPKAEPPDAEIVRASAPSDHN